ncbi:MULTISPECIES: plasmid mobilization relaxosome protein MobC [unclassified Aerococcus]|uniref:plasmid mobilization protein n=1 Tax=unclassified Aerococcus TaxID=2618060 RepID=UPI0008A4437C|nr:MULTISPECIES: plasmid mobilization relaxosome protein MobC [unclassified Aerococcus]MDK6679222.1 plasmid mobilization relaxosome protein MobC [Aerococcus sp. UMB8608]MDK6685936.1 plasmid mobilization relaxosome protein MobC [Aerococcus sp. UMB8623]MDK6939297.1 plasmid mobilization relaxosome protein MobC [Aerococcus sp. UMB8487]OFK19133.1 hypothetical protein HMPREF2829_01420 [Aerococcus sp. HMSC072A12]OFR32559.1 hypothetical protein HMPREF2892_08070 [Aerococcus sp. HMSC061A03]
MEKKTKTIHLKVTEKQREQIHKFAEKCGYSSTSKFILDCIYDPVLFVEDVSEYAKLNTNINRAATNVNQIAKRVNINEFAMMEDIKEVKECILQMKAFCMYLNRIRHFEKQKLMEFYSNGHYNNSSN